MKTRLHVVLFLALGPAAAVASSAVAQNNAAVNDRDNPQLAYALLDASQGNGLLRQVDWDDHHRCDGDHDRDDRHCYYRDRDWDCDHYYGGYAYGYIAPNYVRSGGWYDRNGNFYPSGGGGYFDKHGKWHRLHDRDDR